MESICRDRESIVFEMQSLNGLFYVMDRPLRATQRRFETHGGIVESRQRCHFDRVAETGSGIQHEGLHRPSTGESMPTTVSVASVQRTPSLEGQTVRVQGWVRTRRDSKAGLSFVNLSDGSCQATLQLVVPSTLANYASEVLRLTAGCSIEAEGTLVKGQGKTPTLELQASSLKVHGFVDDPDTYPIQPKPHTYEYLREVAHLRPRTNTFGAVGRIRHCRASSSGCTRRSSRPATARVRARCSA
jgi:OB-fold nucleic acid binding domain